MPEDFVLVKCPHCCSERAVRPEEPNLLKCGSCGRRYHLLMERYTRAAAVTPIEKITTIDEALQVYSDRDLNSAVVAQLSKGVEIHLGSSTIFEGRQWIEATVEGANSGFLLYSSACGHTTLGG